MYIQHGIVLVLLSLMVTSINCEYILRVQFHSYINFGNRCSTCRASTNEALGCCDNISNKGTCSGNERCDTYFVVCLNALGRPDNCFSSSRTKTTNINLNDGAIDFSQETFLGIPNPLEFNGVSRHWDGATLLISAYDEDGSTDALIDFFRIELSPGVLRVDQSSGVSRYIGRNNIARADLSFLIECAENFGGSSCGNPITVPTTIPTTIPTTVIPTTIPTTETTTAVSTEMTTSMTTTIVENIVPEDMQTNMTTTMQTTTSQVVTPTTPPTNDADSELIFLIAGIGGGLLIVGVCIIILLIVIFVILRKKRSQKQPTAQIMATNPPPLPNRNKGLSTMNSAVNLPLPPQPGSITSSDTKEEDYAEVDSYVYIHQYDYVQAS